MKNLRRQLLINPGFQIRFAFLFTATVLAFCLVTAGFCLGMFELMQGNPFFRQHQEALQALQGIRRDLVLILFVVFTLIGTVCFVIALYHSHRIAGPLYKLRLAMISLQQGVLDHHIQFRQKDNFPEMADGFNAMADAIFIRRRRDFERLASVTPKLERLRGSLQGEEQAIAHEVLNAVTELSRDSQRRQ
ncbi:MAG: hypothetical protein HUU37_01235 [Bdellovibrionales bacterium]|nr:hypothetical protein [Bdellovibrionales bacterium]